MYPLLLATLSLKFSKGGRWLAQKLEIPAASGSDCPVLYLALLVALMGGVMDESETTSGQRNPATSKNYPHPGEAGDAKRCTADATVLTG